MLHATRRSGLAFGARRLSSSWALRRTASDHRLRRSDLFRGQPPTLGYPATLCAVARFLRLAPACAAACLVATACGTGKTMPARTGTGVAPKSATASSGHLLRYRVRTGSMEPTIAIGERVFVERGRAVHVGDIVVYHPPENFEVGQCGPSKFTGLRPAGAACSQSGNEPARLTLIKRVVAGSGDVISIVGGRLVRNGKREPGGYIRPCGSQAPHCNYPTPITIPAGTWFLLGDNRGESLDSREYGPIPASWTVAIVRWCGSIGRRCGVPREGKIRYEQRSHSFPGAIKLPSVERSSYWSGRTIWSRSTA